MRRRGREPFTRGVPGVAYRLHERIELERAKRGWSKDKMAAAMKVSRNTLDTLPWRVEPPQMETVTKIADMLEVDRAEVAELAGILSPPSDNRSAAVREAIAVDPWFSAEQKQSLLTIIAAYDALNAGQPEQRDVS